MGNNKNELLNIFSSDEDKTGNDLLKMSSFLSVSIEKLNSEINTETTWEIPQSIERFFGVIAEAIKTGIDISQIGTLVADHSHFSQEIIDGLKKGIYHIGKSKEVAGNWRPAILDDKEQLVKFFTLKKALNPSAILGDISTLSMQAALHKISIQLEEINRGIKTLIESNRNRDLKAPFLNARNSIIKAANNENEFDRYLADAEEYLNDGTTNLYLDIDLQIENLSDLANKQFPQFPSIKSINEVLSFFVEDMQMLSQYVGLSIYLFNYRQRTRDAADVFERYHSFIYEKLEDKKYNGYSAFELIHDYYPYNEEKDIDFWINEPPKMLDAINSYQKMLTQNNTDIYYIEAEESENE